MKELKVKVSITLDSDTNMITLERQPMTDRYWKNNFSPKWYFSAIPLDEVPYYILCRQP